MIINLGGGGIPYYGIIIVVGIVTIYRIVQIRRLSKPRN